MKELKTLRDELNRKYGSEGAPIIWHIHVAETFDEADKIRKAFNVDVERRRDGVSGLFRRFRQACYCGALCGTNG
jgi:hypothetical protein